MRYVLGITLGLYFGSIILLNIPYIQQEVSLFIAEELSSSLNTKVKIGKVNIGLFNRIIVDELRLDDQSGNEMLKVTRLSVKFNPILLFKGKISIGSVQLFGFTIALNKSTPDTESNFKFILDALKPAKTTSQTDKSIDLRINSILIGRGKLTYDVLSEKETPGKFNPKHIKLYNIAGNISLKALSSDSIHAHVKRLSADEQSGLELGKLSLKLLGNNQRMTIENFEIGLPGSSLRMDTIRMDYDSLKSFSRFLTDVRFSFKMNPSHITLQDISPLLPVLSNFREKINVELEANGTVDQLNITRLFIHAGNYFRVVGDVSFQDLSQSADAFIFGHISNLSANKEGVDFLTRNLSENYTQTHQLLRQLGDVSFRGEISGYFTDLVTYGVFYTEPGVVKVDVKLSSNKEKGLFSYSGRVKTDEFQLNHWLDNDKWGIISFNLDVESSHYKQSKYPTIVAKGLVSTIEYSNYRYENISLDGEYKDGGFEGKVLLDDTNGSVLLNGSFNLSKEVPTFNFSADVKNIHPNELNLTPKYQDSEFSLKVKADFTGASIDEMIGSIDIDSLLFVTPDKKFSMNNMRILATHNGNRNVLSVRSDFLRADIEGSYSYRTLPASIINTVKRYVPSLFNLKKEVITNNNFSFDVHIYDSEILPVIFDIPLSIYTHSTVKGYVNDRTDRIYIEGYFPHLRYGNNFIESGMILCENQTNHLKGIIRFSNHRRNNAVNVSLDVQAQNDELITQLNWGNNSSATYSGHFLAHTLFSRAEDDYSSLKTVVDIKETGVILNDTAWKIYPSQIVAEKKKIHINNFNFGRGDQYLHINGYASEDANDTIKVDLKDINIDYIFDITNFKSVDFKGSASGMLIVKSALKNPIMNTRLFVRDFSFNDGVFGNMNLYGEWVKDEEGIYIDAKIKEKDISNIDVKGYIYPLKPKSGLDLHIAPRNGNMKFLESYVSSIVSGIKGRTSGNIRLYGGFSTLNLQGAAEVDATFKVNVLNSNFILKDSVYLTPEKVSFRNASVRDTEKGVGSVNGYIQHRHFKNMSYRLEMNANNMLIMNTKEDPDASFYGTVYGTGNALLTGNNEGLNVNAAFTTNRNTNFIYTMASAASATSNQFIKFIDKTPSRNLQDTIQLASRFELEHKKKEEKEEFELDTRLNIQVDVTPDANVKIIMDPISGDFITGKGTGSIRLEYFNKGDARMFGNFNISHGVYKFSLQEVIRKDFVIKEGSHIAFNGNPNDANIDIQAAYTVNSATLSDLVPRESLAALGNVNNVRVNCLMNLSGSLLRPTIKLGIDLPNEPDEIQNLVQNYINTEEDINTQILYLLAIGKFYTPNYASATQSSNMMTSVLSSTLSGQFNRMFSQFTNSNNWNIGTNVSTGERGWADIEIEGILSAQLLNNRLLINGNFGYRDNPLTNTNFVGDFEAEWLLTRSGDIRLKAYNETNDNYYVRTNLTTQGIGIIYRKDFNRWSDLFFWRKFRFKTKTSGNSAEPPKEEQETGQ